MRTLDGLLTKAYLPFCIGMLLVLPALWSGLAVDDYWHWAVFTQPEEARGFIHEGSSMFGFADGNVERTRRFMDLGAFPWWTLETVKLSFWRPLTFLTHQLDYALWPAAPWMMHLHSLLWWAGILILVTLLYRKFLGAGWTAGLAALLYAVDDGHSLPVGWIANRNALVATFFGLLTILLHDTWRTRGRKSAAIGAVACLFLGLLGKEEAIATTAFLLAYAIFLDRGSWRARMATLAPYALAVVVWRSLYQLQSYGAYGSATYLDPIAAPIAFARAVIERFPVLLLAQWTIVPGEPFIVIPYEAQLLWSIFAAVVLGAILAVMLPVVRRDATAKFLLVGTALAALPACATFPSDRLLLISGFGAMGLLAIFLRAVRSGLYRDVLGGWAHRGAAALAVVFVLSHLIVAPLILPVRIVAYGMLGNWVARLSEGVPLAEEGEDKTLVIIDSPNLFFTTYLPIFSAYGGQRVPFRIWSLAPQTVVSVPLTVTRVAERALEMTPSRGFDWLLFRDDEHPFAVGDRVELQGRTVEVLKVSERGVPLKVVYRFERSLDDPHFVWLYWDDEEFMGAANEIYKPFTPPRVGQTIQLNSD